MGKVISKLQLIYIYLCLRKLPYITSSMMLLGCGDCLFLPFNTASWFYLESNILKFHDFSPNRWTIRSMSLIFLWSYSLICSCLVKWERGGVWERDALLNICNALWVCAFRLILFLFHILSLVMFDNQRYTRLHDYFIMTISICITLSHIDLN